MARASTLLLLALASAACSDEASQRVQHDRIAAVRTGLNVIKAAPGGPLARFADVRLIGAHVVCGTVDGQDGIGPRHFGVAHGEAVIEQPDDPATRAAVARTCTGGPSRKVVSRNPIYSDIDVEEQPS
ncbi:hypothetical protein [Sphingomonas sp.]|uniref:hypothetical protein n=1 Tax=Sphingomonas sp. TaxID=28214 RepID=UPI0035BC6E73